MKTFRILSLLLLSLTTPVMSQEAAAPQQVTPAAATDFSRSALAEQLAACPETQEGISRKIELIIAELNENAEAYHMENLPKLDSSLIPIRVSPKRSTNMGVTHWDANSSSARFSHSIFTSTLPAARTDSERHLREMHLVDTIVHELAHCYLHMRYNYIGKKDDGLGYTISEGFAMHVARTFLRRNFPHITATTRYDETFVSRNYANEYRQFRSRFTDNKGCVNWEELDRIEVSFAPRGYTITNRIQRRGSRNF